MATIALQRLIDAVAKEKTEIASALAFIRGVPQMIRDAVANASIAGGQTSDQALNDLAAQIEVSTADIEAALAANTPSAPAPAPAETTAPPPAASSIETAPTTSGEGTPSST